MSCPYAKVGYNNSKLPVTEVTYKCTYNSPHDPRRQKKINHNIFIEFFSLVDHQNIKRHFQSLHDIP